MTGWGQNMNSSFRRRVAYGGLVFFVLVLAAVVISPSEPSSNATAAKVFATYHKHRTEWAVNGFIIEAAVIVGLFYFWYLRDYISRITAGTSLATIGYAGVVVFAISGTVGAGVHITIADAAGDGNVSASVIQTLNLLNNDFNLIMNGAGAATFLLATGIAVLRYHALPKWLGWVAVVFGVISLTGIPGPAGPGLWVLLASITMLVSQDAVPVTGEAATPAAVS